MDSYYERLISKAIPGATGGFELTIPGCAQERGRAIALCKDADKRIAALEADLFREQQAHGKAAKERLEAKAENERLRDLLRKARGWVGPHDAPWNAWREIADEIDKVLERAEGGA